MRIYLEFEYRRIFCHQCRTVRQETLSWLADSRRFTQRFEDEVGHQCREMSIKRVAEIYHLSWFQAQRMEMAYMNRLLAKYPMPATLRAIGIDEISIRKRHSYRIVVADLDE